MTPTTDTNGILSTSDDIADLRAGRCTLCGHTHSGFGRDERTGLWLAVCRCGAIYQFSANETASTPSAIQWFRATSRARKTTVSRP